MVREVIEAAFREQSHRVIGALLRRGCDLDLAEDVLQDALVVALSTWPTDGVPDNPAAWITRVAARKAIDRKRRDAVLASKRPALAVNLAIDQLAGETAESSELPDDRLMLMFACCHPALPLHARVALTLRIVGGLGVLEIARAFLVAESTMAQRLTRARRRVRQARVPFARPEPADLPHRLNSVLAVLYLIFNEGYSATAGNDLTRPDLCVEAMRLAEVMTACLPDEPEALGLNALMMLQHSRRSARVSRDGELVVLEKQDRAMWDRAMIERGIARLERALAMGRTGPYQIQAAIAAVHSEAPTAAETDWAQILALYDLLVRIEPSPVVRLNRAVAVAMASGAATGLREIERAGLLEALDDYPYLHATRADLLRRVGKLGEARHSYRRARALTSNAVERAFLSRRLATCDVDVALARAPTSRNNAIEYAAPRPGTVGTS
jgi:RNA polymerase sigma-70 factor (ECF subfamily)